METPAQRSERQRAEHQARAVAEIEGDDYDYRAANAEGVVLAVRRNDNDPQGDLTFWSGALDAHLQRKGYTPEKTTEVHSADGITGKQVR